MKYPKHSVVSKDQLYQWNEYRGKIDGEPQYVRNTVHVTADVNVTPEEILNEYVKYVTSLSRIVDKEKRGMDTISVESGPVRVSLSVEKFEREVFSEMTMKRINENPFILLNKDFQDRIHRNIKFHFCDTRDSVLIESFIKLLKENIIKQG